MLRFMSGVCLNLNVDEIPDVSKNMISPKKSLLPMLGFEWYQNIDDEPYFKVYVYDLDTQYDLILIKEIYCLLI